MKTIHIILNKCLHYFLAFQILNLSFGNLAIEERVFSTSSAESNEIDSAFEYVTEYMLGWTNFVPEKHKARQDSHFLKGTVCYFYCQRQEPADAIISYQNTSVHSYFLPGPLSEYDEEITPPPPKSALSI